MSEKVAPGTSHSRWGELPPWRDDARVAAIVVNYRTPELTIACVESILASDGVDPRVVVVDNASNDDSVARLRARFDAVDEIAIVARATNDGYAGGNNAGVTLAVDAGARYAFVLNSDTILHRECLRRIVADAERDPRIALVTPRILYGDQPDRTWFGGSRFSRWRGRPIHVESSLSDARDLDFASGCALLVKLDARGWKFEPDPTSNLQPPTSDLFDASLFSYGEDLDLSLRVQNAGGRIRYVPDATVLHFVGSSHRRAGGESLRFYLSTRNLLRVAARHARWYHWITLAPMLAVDVVGRFAAVAIRERDASAFFAVLRGVVHSVTGGRASIERDVVVPSARRPR
ncbi:MAG TPA: glycosyltransferase family 2 protein [Gemmatimonadaceae bacterium]